MKGPTGFALICAGIACLAALRAHAAEIPYPDLRQYYSDRAEWLKDALAPKDVDLSLAEKGTCIDGRCKLLEFVLPYPLPENTGYRHWGYNMGSDVLVMPDTLAGEVKWPGTPDSEVTYIIRSPRDKIGVGAYRPGMKSFGFELRPRIDVVDTERPWSEMYRLTLMMFDEQSLKLGYWIEKTLTFGSDIGYPEPPPTVFFGWHGDVPVTAAAVFCEGSMSAIPCQLEIARMVQDAKPEDRIHQVPEPAGAVLLWLGLLCLGWRGISSVAHVGIA